MKTFIKSSVELIWNKIDGYWDVTAVEYDIIQSETKPRYTVRGATNDLKVVTRYALMTPAKVDEYNALTDDDERIEFLTALANEQGACSNEQMLRMERYTNRF